LAWASFKKGGRTKGEKSRCKGADGDEKVARHPAKGKQRKTKITVMLESRVAVALGSGGAGPPGARRGKEPKTGSGREAVKEKKF